jgi:prolyl oligopeptidase
MKTAITAGLAMLMAAAALAADAPLKYPPTRRVEQVDLIHGVRVPDPYRWLEDDVRTSAEVAEWVAAQNKLTDAYLQAIPQRDAIRRRLTELWNFPQYSAPMKAGTRYFFFRNDGLQNQSVLYEMDSLDGQPRVVLDPNQWSADGTVALSGLGISDDGRYLAFARSEAGSDWSTWQVMDVANRKILPDELKWIKFSGAAWTKDNKGFFYARYDQPREGAEFQSLNFNNRLCYHRLGTPQSADALVYWRREHPDWHYTAAVSDDGRWLVILVSKGTDARNRVLVRDLTEPYAMTVELIDNFEHEYSFIGNEGETLYFKTDLDAPRGRVVAVDFRAGAENLPSPFGRGAGGEDGPAKTQNISPLPLGEGPGVRAAAKLSDGRSSNQTALTLALSGQHEVVGERGQNVPWREIIPQTEATLASASMVGDSIFACYLKDVTSQVKQFDLQGKPVREVSLPGIGAASGFGGRRSDKETFYSFASIATPPRIYRYDPATGQSRLWRQAEVKFNPDDYEVRQVFYKSKDGTRVPMFIAHRKGIKLDGSNPTLLYGYGGFNISLLPRFSVGVLAWMELGGIYAQPNLRGGGEYGEEWHRAGTKLRKQNVFDDFIAAAEWLIAEKYTRPNRLAASGGSNGGLLVGAVMTQRPELFGACLPQVGVMDMLRFHKFTEGREWIDDYGSADNPQEFKALLAYSPYHCIRRGTCYPATLISTADTDDRVVPGHSFKFAAALQHAQGCANPALITISVRAGHGGGKPVNKRIAELADQWAFLVKNLNMQVEIPPDNQKEPKP